MFLGVLLHTSLCAPGVHAGTIHATACASRSVADVLPLDAIDGGGGAAPVAGRASDDRAGQPGRPCTPVPRPHHAPCGALTDRGTGQHRAAAAPTAVLPHRSPGPATGLAAAPARGDASLPPARPYGAGLLIDLCASRT